MYLVLYFVENWDNALEAMNKNKKGRPHEFHEQFIKFMAFVHIIFGMPYRQMEGFTRKLSELIPPLKTADYTTLQKRIVKMKLELADTISEKIDDVIIAVGSSEVKVTNRGEWMREKWKIHRGWIKVRIAVDIKTKEVLAIGVADACEAAAQPTCFGFGEI